MSTRPRITFDSEGKCNACTWSSEKKVIDWSQRRLELTNRLKEIRNITFKQKRNNFTKGGIHG